MWKLDLDEGVGKYEEEILSEVKKQTASQELLTNVSLNTTINAEIRTLRRLIKDATQIGDLDEVKYLEEDLQKQLKLKEKIEASLFD